VHDEIALVARHTAPRGRTPIAGVIAELAQPVMVVGASMPVGELEVIFRRPDVACVAVQDELEHRVGIITRAGLAGALTGRLGYGRAVLERKPAASVTDWSPLVVNPSALVSEVATRAMARQHQHRYDDVLVAGPTWSSAGTADVMRALVAALADRSTHDPQTRLPTRAATWHSLTHRCSLVAGGGTRVLLLLLDVRGMATINARHGQDTGDAVLVEVAARLMSTLPRGCEAGRVDGDRFAVLATLPVMDDIQAAASAEALRQHVLSHLEEPSGAIDRSVWPALHSGSAWSVKGAANPDELIGQAEQRLAMDARNSRLDNGLPRRSSAQPL
jgi:diguanylate cyclase (GGDEF)-like protein